MGAGIPSGRGRLPDQVSRMVADFSSGQKAIASSNTASSNLASATTAPASVGNSTVAPSQY
jgi:hypothetical protein